MQGIILAAGRGKRLAPITLTRSKAMAPILGKPIVERVMDDLAASGVRDFILVISPDDDQIVRYFQTESRLDADVRFVFQAERLGMAHALQCAAPEIRDDFVLSACDNLVSAQAMGRIMEAWRARPKPNAVLALMPVELERLGSVGIVEMKGPWVTRIVEKPAPEEAPSTISSMPLYCFSQRVLDYLPEVPLSARGEYELQDAIQMVIERDGNVRGTIINERLTLTSPEDLLTINRHYLASDGLAMTLGSAAAGAELVAPLYIEPGTEIGQGCIIGPNVYIERGCHIGDRVTLRNTVVLRDSVVPAGSRIEGEIVS